MDACPPSWRCLQGKRVMTAASVWMPAPQAGDACEAKWVMPANMHMYMHMHTHMVRYDMHMCLAE